MVRRCSYFDSWGLVESLTRADYERDLLDWVYEDEIPFEGCIIVRNRVTHDLRYVVVGEFPVMRAKIAYTGEILEIWGDLSFKRLYRSALLNARSELRNDLSIDVVFESGAYSDYEYLNSCGYMQRDFIPRETLAVIRFSKSADEYSIERID